MISTKGRYALRVLIDLAEQGDGKPVRLKDVANRQGISEKYLQHVAKLLVNSGFISGSSGKGGGYMLNRDPAEMTVDEVLVAAEGTLAPVACLADGAAECDRAPICKTLPMWKEFNAKVHDYFGGITIADLAGSFGEK